MQPTNPHTSTTLATRLAALAIAAPWRRSARLASLAIGLGGFVSSAQASLQVYEGFDYTLGQTLNGQTGGTGFAAASAWSAGNTGTSPYTTPNGISVCDASTQTLWNGTVTSVPQTGKYVGSPAPAANGSSGYNGNNPGDEWATRPLDASVTATFTLGNVTWMSYVEASNFKANGNGTGGSFAIAKGNIGSAGGSNRGWTSYGGSAIGIGVDSSKKFRAAYWNGNAAGVLGGTQGASWNTTGVAQISIAKITWGDATTATTIEEATFNDGTVLTVAAFDAAKVITTVTFDPTGFANLAIGGARYNVDELRVGTAFDDVIGIVVAATGNYWAPGIAGGGAGTWSSSSNVWSANPNSQGTGGQAATGLLIFSSAAGTVTIDGTVSAVAGIEFATTGYSLVAGASSPNLSLTGADPATNVLDVVSGTTTISAAVTGSNGMTKNGTGTLVLSDTANTYGGGTMLNAGALNIAGLGCLGSGNVTFGGGILQYPAGSGASALDVSARIDAVSTGKVAKIDTNGNDVTFATSVGGDGGLTKLGAGSLTLGASISSLAGAVTVSGGTLDVSSASGTITTLNVPVGGTVNLGTGAVVTNLNVTGGTVHITGTGVQVGTLVATNGTLEAVTPFAVTTQATVAGVALSGTAMTLRGANVIVPDSANHRVVTASSGTLGLVATGIAAAIGKGAPGIPALPATTTFSGSGAWTMHGGLVQSFSNNVYGFDNHAFQYIQIPSGNFDIRVHVTGLANAQVGLGARNTLASAYDSAAGNDSVAIWAKAASVIINGAMTIANNLGTMSNTPWLRIIKSGEVVTSYYSSDNVTYTLAQQQDYTATPWGPTTYIGLDLTDTSGAIGSASGTFADVSFMGTGSMPDLPYTELELSGGALANVECKAKLGKLTINSVPQLDGAYNATNTPLSVSGSGALIIGDNSATVTLADLSQTYDGAAKAATATPTPSGPTVNITYNGSATAPTNAGSYMVEATIDDPYYVGFTTGTLVITKAEATVILGSLSQGYDGSAKAATATTTPSGLTVTFTYDPAPPIEIGSYTVVGTVNNANYTGTATGTLEITSVTDYSSWASAYLPTDVSNLAADTDGDGMSNFMEYAFGLNPTSGTSVNPISQPLDKGTGEFKYTRRKPSLTALTYSYEWSSTLVAPWGTFVPVVDPPVSNGGDPIEEITIQVPGSLLANPALFLRVKAQ